MLVKFFMLCIVLIFSTNLVATTKTTKLVKIDDEEVNSNNISLSGDFNGNNINEIANKVYQQLSTDKKIEKLKKDRDLYSIILQFDNFKNKTNQHIPTTALQSMITRILIIKRKGFRVMASKRLIKKIQQEKEADDKSLGSGLKPYFIFTGALKGGKKEIKGDFKIYSYIFEYKLINSNNNVVYQNSVTVKNRVKIRIPIWVKMKDGAYFAQNKQFFISIGTSKDSKKESIKSSKRKLVKVLNKYLQELYKVYDENKKTDKLTKKQLEKNIVQVLEIAVKEKFKIAEIKDNWTNPKNNKVYTLLILDFKTFQNLVNKDNGFNKNFVNKFKKYSETSFNKLKTTIESPKSKSKSKSKKVQDNKKIINRPKWVMAGAGTFTIKGKKVFRVLGLSANIETEMKTMQNSVNDAKKNLSFVMRLYFKALNNSYKKLPKFKKDITLIKKYMDKSEYPNAQTINRWIEPRYKSIYTLLEIDLNDFQKEIKKIKGLSRRFIETFDEHSAKAYKEVNGRLKKVGDF